MPSFQLAGRTFTRLGVTSNGYLVAGGVSSATQITPLPQHLLDPAQPNAVLAPFWTNLDGTGAPGIQVANLTDGVDNWIVVEWRELVAGTTSPRTFQVWVGINGTEDVTYAYDPANLPAAPPGALGLTVGAENFEGTGGAHITSAPIEDLRVASDPALPGGTLTYSFQVQGVQAGTGDSTTAMVTPLVRGVTTEVDKITVN